MKQTLKSSNYIILYVVLAAFIAIIALFIGAGNALSSQNEQQIKPPEAIFNSSVDVINHKGQQIPFPSLDFMDMSDEIVSSDSFKGQYRLINIWASWCGPCLVEIPSLLDLEEELGAEKLDVVFVSFDFPENADGLRTLMRRHNKNIFDSLYTKGDDVWGALSVQALPMSYLVNPQGNIDYIYVGEVQWNSPKVVAHFKSIISNSQ